MNNEDHMAAPTAGAAKVFMFDRFQIREMSFCGRGVVFRDILTCLIKCRKSVCVTGEILVNSLLKMTFIL